MTKGVGRKCATQQRCSGARPRTYLRLGLYLQLYRMLGSQWVGTLVSLLYELNYPWDRCNLIPLKPTRLAEHFFHSIRLHSAVAAVIPHPHGCSAEGRYKLHTCTHSTIYMIYYLTSYIEYKGMFLELRALLCLFVFALKLNSSTNLQTLL